MAKVKIQGHASGTGILTVTAPNTSTDRTITLPDSTGTILDENSSLPAANITGTLPAIDGSNLTGLTATLAALTDATVSASDPAADSNPSATGHLWVNKTSGEAYVATNVTTDDNVWTNIGPGTGDVESPLTVDYLVIAGGGGAGSRWHGGGAGAGGYRNSYNSEPSGGGGSSETALTLVEGTEYTITVGAGGAGGSGSGGINRNGVSGTNSSISGSDITDVTSTAGGYGGGYDQDGATGGSGGGSGGHMGTGASGAGTSNQGYAGGRNNASNGSGGGGGGASEAGEITTNDYTGTAGAGGDGLASSITGSSVTRGGGGGGGATTPGAGGAGGGGSNSNGTANTGGGGGGTSANLGNGYAGGSGVVILRMKTSKYSSTTTGSPTVSTDGTDTILVYNASGTYTA
jgi:hypothetical protein